MRFVFILAMAIFNLTIIPPELLLAEASLTIEYEYYSVKPQTGRAVYSQMFKDSPLVHKNGKVVAITHWNIEYNIDYTPSENGFCDIKRYEVLVPCKTILPRLISDEKN